MVRVLIVDDEEMMRELLVAYVSQIGEEDIESVSCRNIPEARVALERPFDLVICDFDTGVGGSGLDLLNEIRANGIQVPFVLHCSDPGLEVVEAVRAHGGTFIPKPTLRRKMLEDIFQSLFVS